MKEIKRLAVMLLVAVLAVGSASAQFRFGVKAGVNMNKFDFNDIEANFKASNGCGFTGGVMTEFQVPVIGICLDASLMYTRMNSDVSLDNKDETKSSAKNFFNIPVNLKYKLSLPAVSNIVAPYIFTGPDFAFKLGGKDDVFKTKTFQCAWNVGLGVELINHLQISGSYAFGVNNVFDTLNIPGENMHLTNSIKTKNNYWTVTAAWLF